MRKRQQRKVTTMDFTDKYGFGIDDGDGFGECPGCGESDVVLFLVKGTDEVECTACEEAAREAKAEADYVVAEETFLGGAVARETDPVALGIEEEPRGLFGRYSFQPITDRRANTWAGA